MGLIKNIQEVPLDDWVYATLIIISIVVGYYIIIKGCVIIKGKIKKWEIEFYYPHKKKDGQ